MGCSSGRSFGGPRRFRHCGADCLGSTAARLLFSSSLTHGPSVASHVALCGRFIGDSGELDCVAASGRPGRICFVVV
jgi:hypothetical protein